MSERARLILASSSPRRRELLGLFDLAFDIEPAAIDEAAAEAELPRDHVVRLAREKARAVHVRHHTAWVLAADTVVAVDDDILGKPADADQARKMLERLSGRAHRVFSAVAMVSPDGTPDERLSETLVEFAPLPSDWIADYIESGEPHDKAGAYGIQGRAGIWVRSLTGSYSGVVGLPLFETGELLRTAGLLDQPE